MTRKTIARWAYPFVVLASWILLAAYTLSALSTVEPTLRSIAASRPQPTAAPLVAAAVPVARQRSRAKRLVAHHEGRP